MYSNNALTSDSILKIDAIYKYEGDTATEKLLFFRAVYLKAIAAFARMLAICLLHECNCKPYTVITYWQQFNIFLLR